MLGKFILRTGAIAVAMTCAVGSASAENYRVLMLDYAFFPEISYVSPGDTVTFVNTSGMTRTIEGSDGEWIIEDLEDGAEATLPITSGMKNEYTTVAVAASGESSEAGTAVSDEDEIVIGKLNFSGLANPILD
ncbi:MAG: hypothetical protein ABJP06_16345 [Sulfitobacter sp.]